MVMFLQDGESGTTRKIPRETIFHEHNFCSRNDSSSARKGCGYKCVTVVLIGGRLLMPEPPREFELVFGQFLVA